MKRKKSSWNIHLMSVYYAMKKSNPSIKLKEAMKEAKKSYKK